MSEQATLAERITPDELHKRVTALCAAHGYQLIVAAIGKKSGKLSPWVDVVADTHIVDLVYVEANNGATA